jgi:hypothetical protein
MATERGQDGSIKWNSSTVAECRSWVLNSPALDTIEDTVKGDTSKTFKTGLLDPGTATVVVYLDYAATGQGAIIDDIVAGTGTEATLLLIVNTGKEFSVNAIPTSFSAASPEGSSIVESTIEFRLSGDITVNWA